jgi:hypothetical protein
LELAAVVFVLDAFHELPRHQCRDGAADAGFVRSGAMRNVLRAARIIAESERAQAHAIPEYPARSVAGIRLTAPR